MKYIIPKIDRNVPIAERSHTNKRLPTHHNNGDKRRTTYPFHRMRVGDSFFLPDAGRHAIHRAIWAFRVSPKADRINWQFTIRQWMQDGVYGYRVWRTE